MNLHGYVYILRVCMYLSVTVFSIQTSDAPVVKERTHQQYELSDKDNTTKTFTPRNGRSQQVRQGHTQAAVEEEEDAGNVECKKRDRK